MKKTLISAALCRAAPTLADARTAADDGFRYTDEQFADIQMLRYRVDGFERLSLREKTFIYYLQEAALSGRDILFDQNGRYNLRIVRLLEAVYTHYRGDRRSAFFTALTTYLKRVWFSSGIHHHYGCEKFLPEFSADDLRAALAAVPAEALPLEKGQTVQALCDELFPVMFDPAVMPMRVNQRDGDDLVATSAANYYAPGITQAEAEQFYAERKPAADPRPVMMGMNSRVERDEFGQLTERVRRRPYSVVLFDEIEKAHPDVFNLLLQVLDDGRITDSQGRTVNFRNTIIIMTSNLGSDIILDGISPDGSISEDAKSKVTSLLRRSFRPEFLNRIDETVFYRPLTENDIRAICRLQLDALRHRLEDNRLGLEVSDAAEEYIAKSGYDPIYGARPLKRFIQSKLETVVAQYIIGKDPAPESVLKVDYSEDKGLYIE